MALVAVLVAFGAAADPGTLPAADPATLLGRAIAAAGGEPALRRATVLRWRGRATVHAGDRRIALEGLWIVEPPDRAVVATWEIDKGKGSTRRLILLGSEGWMERAGQRTPMPPEILANESDQFYLYAVMRLLPLREPGVRLTATGPRSLRVERAGRPDVEMFFDEGGRLSRLRTQIHDPGSERQVAEEVALEGSIEAGGVRWPRRLSITQDGAAFFDLELISLAIASSEDLARAARPR